MFEIFLFFLKAAVVIFNILFYLSLITHWYKKKNNLRLLSFITFVLMCASFDVAMEGVRFPFIFFSSISYLFYEK